MSRNFSSHKHEILRKLLEERVPMARIYDWLSSQDLTNFPAHERGAGVKDLERYLDDSSTVDPTLGLLGQVLAGKRITIFVGVRQLDHERERDMIEGVDVDCLALLAGLQNLGERRNELEIVRVGGQDPELLNAILEREETGDAVLCIGAPRSNAMSEIVLCRLFCQTPFAASNWRPPFGFCWSGSAGHPSPFSLSTSALPADLAALVTQGKGYGFVLGDDVKFVDQQVPDGDTSEDWGVIAAGYRSMLCEESRPRKARQRLLVALCGASGGGTWKATKELARGRILWHDGMDERSTLYVAMQTLVHWQQRDPNLADRRTFRDPEVLPDFPQIWRLGLLGNDLRGTH